MPKKNQTSFSKSRQPKRRRGKDKRTLLLNALKQHQLDEQGFYQLLVDKAMSPDDDGTYFSEVMKRIYPQPKAVAPEVEFNFNEKGNPHEQASAVIKAISEGSIPPDVGVQIIGAVKAQVDIEEATDLKARIEELEKLLNVQTG